MNGRFINDVINFKCDDGVKREAIIIKDSDNGKFDVAYMTSEGCKNVKIKVERDVTENKFHGVSNGKSSILPYSTGDLVAFYVKPEVYYLAHIIEIGSYNTVKIILGDLYMDGWVKDDKRGDILEVNVSDIRWDGSACDFNKKTKIRYGYEPKELRNPNWKKNLLRGIRNVTLTVLMCLLVAYSFPKLINFLNTYEANYNSSSSNSNISTAPITSPQNDFERPTQEDLESYSPLQRVLAELYNKKLEDITQEEIAAISYLSLSEYQGYDSNFSYSARCKIDDGEEHSIHFDDDDGIDSYNFSLFTGVSELELSLDNLKNIDFIKDMPQVTTLNLSNSAVTDITALSNSSIENLTLDKNSEIADYTSLSQMAKLNNLTISCDEELLYNFTQNLESVETLCLDGMTEYGILDFCPNAKNLTIQFFSQHYSDIDVTNITQKSGIENLEFKNANIGTGATMLFNMPNLKSLSLDTCQLRMNPDNISDNLALSSLSIKSIEILDNYKSETDGFFTYVDYDVIELSEHMDFFSHFNKLKKLTVSGQKINDVNAFCNITTLETLDLTDNNISDFSPLASLSNLKSLTIKNNSFTEDPSNIKLGNDVEIIQ